jgi:hypothetical protein
MSVESELASLQRISDRLLSTSNENLQNVLEVLLPKLLPMANNEALRDKQVIPIFIHILRRIKPLKTIIPMRALINLIRPDMMPFCCNFAMAFIDTTSEWHPLELWSKSAESLTLTLIGFSLFTPQSNALCYYSLFCISSLCLLKGPSVEGNIKNILGDWFIDMSLAQPGIIKDSVGSIQPGLSAERLGRLTTKKNEWTTDNLKPFKLALVQSLSNQWLPTQCAVAIAIICSCDVDTDVATQAVFKMNGARSILPDINLDPLSVLDLLLTLCLPLSQTMQTYQQHPFIRQRTTLRDSVKCAILRWICKEMSDHILVASKNIVALFAEILKPYETSSMSAIYTSHIIELAALLTEKLNYGSLMIVASIIIQCVKKALQPFISLLSTRSDSGVDSEAGIVTFITFY